MSFVQPNSIFEVFVEGSERRSLLLRGIKLALPNITKFCPYEVVEITQTFITRADEIFLEETTKFRGILYQKENVFTSQNYFNNKTLNRKLWFS